MKNSALILASVFGLSLQSLSHGFGYSHVNSYADAIVFDEMGVTFAVYPDGEFDFYLDNACQSTTLSNGYVNVTFNSGYDYGPYVQYDDFGAVIQVENVPVWYDYYGRVSRIGDVRISYRNRRVCQVGGLYLHYNQNGYYAYHTGFINVWNPYFVYRPFYVAFARPTLCFVHVNPYRQFYRPVRYTYYRPYVHNVRPCFATIGHTYRPQGHGQAHYRYTQTAGRGELPVRRERRKITTANAVQRPVAVNRARTNSSRNDATYSRSSQNTRPANVRSSSSRTSANSRNVLPNRSSASTSTSRTVQTAPNRSSGSTRVNQHSTGKPTSVSNRTSSTSSRGEKVRPSRRGASSSRTVKPTGASRTQSVNRTTSRSSSNSDRSVQPKTSSRSSASRKTMTTKPSNSVNRHSSTRSSVSKGSGSSSRSGGKASVGGRTSKRGR